MKSISPSSNFLESRSDNEIGVIHGYKISSELAREVILILEFFPVDVRFRILSLLKGMGYSALQWAGKYENSFSVLDCKRADQMLLQSN